MLNRGNTSSSRDMFVRVVGGLFSDRLKVPFVKKVFLYNVLTTVVSATSSRLLMATSTTSRSLCRRFVGGSTSSGRVLTITELAIVIISILTFIVT